MRYRTCDAIDKMGKDEIAESNNFIMYWDDYLLKIMSKNTGKIDIFHVWYGTKNTEWVIKTKDKVEMKV